MSEKSAMKPLALAVGAALATSLGGISTASADTSPFVATVLSSGYLNSDSHGEGKCGEGKCGGDQEAKAEGKCGEGKRGGDKRRQTEGGRGERKSGAGDEAVT